MGGKILVMMWISIWRTLLS